jgi:16S rRNA (guanine(966)-N(2))-methyltransferase RsmD
MRYACGMKKTATNKAPRTGAPHQVRIIGGQWKRTPLPVLDAEGLRPTPDRVRETVFNWLNHLLDGEWGKLNCLDLFAGSGVLGFEAASRGAARVTMVESNPLVVRQLQAIAQKLDAEQIDIVRGDALVVGQRLLQEHGSHSFDLIFADPPYHQAWLPKVLPLCAQLLSEKGLIYAESEMSLDEEPAPEWLNDWEIIRSDKAGMVFFHLLRCRKMLKIEA